MATTEKTYKPIGRICWENVPKDWFDDEDEEEVYLVKVGVDDLCGDHEHLRKFKTYSTEFKTSSTAEGDYKTTYFQTYGGGPEGGYFLRIFSPLNGFDPVEEVYKVERNWGTPFTFEKLNGVLHYNEGTISTVRFVPNEDEEDEENDDDEWESIPIETVGNVTFCHEIHKNTPPEIRAKILATLEKLKAEKKMLEDEEYMFEDDDIQPASVMAM